MCCLVVRGTGSLTAIIPVVIENPHERAFVWIVNSFKTRVDSRIAQTTEKALSLDFGDLKSSFFV